MHLGAFSISLSVSDLAASEDFYGHLGFERMGGDPDEGWVILRNRDAIIGLFQGMFEGNILTFNPGLDQSGEPDPDRTDVRDIQAALRDAGVELIQTVDPDSTGAGHITCTDPDGNAILIDQFD